METATGQTALTPNYIDYSTVGPCAAPPADLVDPSMVDPSSGPPPAALWEQSWLTLLFIVVFANL